MNFAGRCSMPKYPTRTSILLNIHYESAAREYKRMSECTELGLFQFFSFALGCAMNAKLLKLLWFLLYNRLGRKSYELCLFCVTVGCCSTNNNNKRPPPPHSPPLRNEGIEFMSCVAIGICASLNPIRNRNDKKIGSL